MSIRFPIMDILLVCLSLIALACGDSSKHYVLKYPAPQPGLEPANPPVEGKPHDSVGATYQAITKRHSGSTTAEILNTISSPHSRSSVSFTTTSLDHSPSETVVHSTLSPPVHPTTPSYIVPIAPSSPKYEGPTVHPIHTSSPHYNEGPTVHTVLHHDYPKLPVPHQVPVVHTSPQYHETPVTHAPHQETPYVLHEAPQYPPAGQHYHLHPIVNDPGLPHYETPAPTYTYRIPPNQTNDYPPQPRVSPKAFNYQPVITLSNNIKSFYKINAYTPFVVPPAYSDSYLSNLVYPGGEVYKYPSGYADAYAGKYKVFPSPVVSYNVTAAPYEPNPHYPTPAPYASPPVPYTSPPVPYASPPVPYASPSPTHAPTPSPPHTPLSLPPPPGLTLVTGVPKPYKDNAYIEPPRPLFTPVLVYKKY